MNVFSKLRRHRWGRNGRCGGCGDRWLATEKGFIPGVGDHEERYCLRCGWRTGPLAHQIDAEWHAYVNAFPVGHVPPSTWNRDHRMWESL